MDHIFLKKNYLLSKKKKEKNIECVAVITCVFQCVPVFLRTPVRLLPNSTSAYEERASSGAGQLAPKTTRLT